MIKSYFRSCVRYNLTFPPPGVGRKATGMDVHPSSYSLVPREEQPANGSAPLPCYFLVPSTYHRARIVTNAFSACPHERLSPLLHTVRRKRWVSRRSFCLFLLFLIRIRYFGFKYCYVRPHVHSKYFYVFSKTSPWRSAQRVLASARALVGFEGF